MRHRIGFLNGFGRLGKSSFITPCTVLDYDSIRVIDFNDLENRRNLWKCLRPYNRDYFKNYLKNEKE